MERKLNVLGPRQSLQFWLLSDVSDLIGLKYRIYVSCDISLVVGDRWDWDCGLPMMREAGRKRPSDQC